MLIKGYVQEDFNQYKLPTMTIATARCSMKCDELNGCQVCQNMPLVRSADREIDNQELIKKYLSNPISKAICIAGLEPIDTFADTLTFIKDFRQASLDEIIIYTGYTMEEMETMGCINMLKQFPNIILKVGRYVMNKDPHYDEVLGVELASPNQYAVRIS